MSRIFVSHSRRDNLEAVALVQWLSEVRPELATEIFIDIGAETGLRPGQKWQEALRQASDRCEAVICLLSRNWQSSDYCRLEYLLAENPVRPASDRRGGWPGWVGSLRLAAG